MKELLGNELLEYDNILIDRQKTPFLLYYLARAYKKVQEREIAHKKLQIALKQLRKVSTKALKKHIDELEGSIHEAIAKEQQILARQTEEDVLHKKLKHKIDALEHALTRFVHIQEDRKQRLKELEERVKLHAMTKRQKILELRKDLQKLRKLHAALKRVKGVPRARLELLEKRIKGLQAKMLARL